MPQIQLPMFPHGTTEINVNLAIERKAEQITYFYGHLPVFTHHVNDNKTFRMITSQLCANGNTTQAEISRTFGVSKISVKRGVKLYHEKGVSGFYEKRCTRGATVLTPSRLKKAQDFFDDGCDVSEVAKELNVKKDTVRKAAEDGRLHAPKKKL